MNVSLKKSDYYSRVARDIAETVCRPCTDSRREHHELNFGDPLACGCRCPTVEHLLKRLKDRSSD